MLLLFWKAIKAQGGPGGNLARLGRRLLGKAEPDASESTAEDTAHPATQRRPYTYVRNVIEREAAPEHSAISDKPTAVQPRRRNDDDEVLFLLLLK